MIMTNNKIDREKLRLLSSGKYLQIYKSYDPQMHSNFVESALFVFDLFNELDRKETIVNKPELLIDESVYADEQIEN
jgi:hypothetical protein